MFLPRRHLHLVVSAGVAALILAGPPSARAAEVTAFAALHTPRENWNFGYGSALGTTWFKVLTLEGEACRTPGDSTDESMTTFTASAMIAPPIGGFTPYGGVGVGVFQQSAAGDNDFGLVRALILGTKVTIKGLIVVKAEIREFELSGRPLIDAKWRMSVGAGIAF